MRKVLTLACLLAVAHYAASQCANIPNYAETFVPKCDPHDVYVKWPNYENQYSYYKCNGVNNPVLVECSSPTPIFSYVLQSCVGCGDYIPPVQCKQLKTQNPPQCVPNGSNPNVPGGSTLPTPNYPDTTTASTTTKTTTTKTTTTKTTTVATPTVVTPPTPPTGSTTNTDIPPPPSPVTNDPNIPMPPTPEPTPPSVPVTPPPVVAPPTA